MIKIIQKLKKLKLPIFILSLFIVACFIIQFTILIKNKPDTFSQDLSTPFQNSVTYESGNILIENQTILDDIIIKFTASVSIVNSTLQGSIYMFNIGKLYILQNSNITQNVVMSDLSTLLIVNSTIGGSIECRDTTSMELFECQTPTTTVWKFDSANIILNNSNLST